MPFLGKKKRASASAAVATSDAAAEEQKAPEAGAAKTEAAATGGAPAARAKGAGGMTTQATQRRMQQLMEMRTGTDKSGHTRSFSKRGGGKKGGRAKMHSMFPNKGGKGKIQFHKSKSDKKPKLVQYRVKNELFKLYDFYKPIRILGQGAYAVVCEAVDTRTGKKVAVKKNKDVFNNLTDARRILREIKLLMHFEHEDVMSLCDVIPPPPDHIEDYKDVYIVMGKMQSTLDKIIRSSQALTERHFSYFIYQMCRGLKYMHSCNVIHRDLKPQNILVNGKDCDLRITDFGLARGVCLTDDVEQHTEYVVTRWYRAPEVICSSGYYDAKIDMWSIGCMLAELMTARVLFPGQNYMDQLKCIFDVMGTPKKTDWIKHPDAKKWVQKLPASPPKDLHKILMNSKLKKKVTPSAEAKDLLSKLLVLDPKDRLSAEEALAHPYLAEFHRKEAASEVTGAPFDLSFEFEKSIKTKFGVRHMMYDSLVDYETKRLKEIADAEAQAEASAAGAAPGAEAPAEPQAAAS